MGLNSGVSLGFVRDSSYGRGFYIGSIFKLIFDSWARTDTGCQNLGSLGRNR